MPKRAQRGFTLIEYIVATSILAIVMTSLVQVIVIAYRTLGQSKAAVTARTLANQRMEVARNLSYANIGTIGGIPSGVLKQKETVTQNGIPYTIETSVVYIDDPYDGLAPTDTLPTDYKRVRVEVSWGGVFASITPIVFISDISPKGVETSTGGGTLKILVFNALGQPTSQAQVHITNTVVTPNIDLTLDTDSFGQVLLPGSPVCSSCYNITVTKTGFSTDITYTTSQVAIPNKPPVTILLNKLTQISFAIDQVSTLTLQTTTDRAGGFLPLGNISVHIRGSKTIGDDTGGNPVYKVDTNYTTDAQGQITLNNTEWDTYLLTENAAPYDISATNPLQPMALAPNTSLTAKLGLSTHTTNSLLLSVTDASGSAIASASASITKSGVTQSGNTGNSGKPDFGQIFFSGLSTGIYSIIATASGYQTTSGSVNVSGQTSQTIHMN